MNKDGRYVLHTQCNFREVFDRTGPAEDSLSSSEQPLQKIGHIRADYDGYCWWGQYFPCRDYLKTSEFVKESQKIYQQLIDTFKNLSDLECYCKAHPEAAVSETEYNFFINSVEADYWIRFVLREKDYNLYLHGYSKRMQID